MKPLINGRIRPVPSYEYRLKLFWENVMFAIVMIIVIVSLFISRYLTL